MAPETRESGAGSSGSPLAAEYERAIAQAVGEFQSRAYREARVAFLAAHRLSPSARTLRGLGMTEFELKHYIASVAYLERALGSGVRPLTGELRAQTEQLLARAQTYVATLRLELLPADAQVLLDGELAAPDARGRIAIEVGDHVLDVTASGYASERRRLTVADNSEQRLRVHLLQQDATRMTESSPLYEKWWFWAAAGSVLAGAVIASYALTTGGDDRAAPSPADFQVMALRAR